MKLLTFVVWQIRQTAHTSDWKLSPNFTQENKYTLNDVTIAFK